MGFIRGIHSFRVIRDIALRCFFLFLVQEFAMCVTKLPSFLLHHSAVKGGREKTIASCAGQK
jgi:hypothetical protein